MNKISKKIIYILLAVVLIMMSFLVTNVYALTDSEAELVQILTEYKNELGDLNQFKEVIDKMYNDINDATTVDDALKAKLAADITELENINGINPLVLNVLEVELSSHIANLTNDNLDEVKQELAVIKGWIDSQVSETPTTPDIPETPDTPNTPDTSDKPVDSSVVKDSKLPQTGKSIVIVLVVLFLLVNIIICIKQYKKYKQI